MTFQESIMSLRSVSRWIPSLFIALTSLLLMNALLTQPDAQARPATTTTCLGSIQACIDAAFDGDTIVIPAGTYTESLTLYKPVSVTGVNSATTIIHAVAGQRVLTVTGAVISNLVVISGLTFTGGNVLGGYGCPQYCGGGLLISDGAQPVLNSLVISDNSAGQFGGGLYAGQSITLEDIIVISNATSYAGGGAYIEGSTYMSNVQFISNTTGSFGGGANIQGSAYVNNARFVRNTANFNDGGGLYIYGSSETQISNTTFLQNFAGEGGGVYIYTAGPAAVIIEFRIKNAKLG